MFNRLKNEKGFTLIELLAVIVIMGVLMMVAIPAMTKYIENSKRDVFADTAKKYISSVRYSVLSDSYQCGTADCGLPDVGGSLLVPCNLIDLDNDTGKSPWSKNFSRDYAWVLIKTTGEVNKPVYTYSFIGTDDSGNGIVSLTEETSIGRQAVKKGTTKASKPVCVSTTNCLAVTSVK